MLIDILRDHILIKFLKYKDLVRLFQLNQEYHNQMDYITGEYIKIINFSVDISELVALIDYMKEEDLIRISSKYLDYLPSFMKQYYYGGKIIPNRYYLEDIILNPNQDMYQFVMNYPTIYKHIATTTNHRRKVTKIKIVRFDLCEKFILITFDWNGQLHGRRISAAVTLRSTFKYGLINTSNKRITDYNHCFFPSGNTRLNDVERIVSNIIPRICRKKFIKNFKYSYSK